jgi:hypothetical protein
MTPTERAPTKPPLMHRPAVLLSGIAAVITVVALLAPDWTTSDTDARLTTLSSHRMGARLLHDLADRLGWDVERRMTRHPPPDTAVIHAVLGGVTPFRKEDVGRLLDRVRAGAALLVIASGTASVFGDSLRARSHTSGYAPNADSLRTVCPRRRPLRMRYWPGNNAYLRTIQWRGAAPDSMIAFIEATPEPPPGQKRTMLPSPAIVGFPYGRGRVVLALDADVVRNDALRGCNYGLEVAAVRALEYLRDGGAALRTRVVFDEYHQEYGDQPGAMTTIGRYLSRTSSGNTLLQLCIAGLLVLIALGPRALPPRAVVRIERRSPFEHVDALGRAYMLVGASRTATSRLVRGLRRRVEPGAFRSTRTLTAEAFLDHVVRDYPALAADAATVRTALANRVSARDFVHVGEALAKLESSLTRF